MNDKTDDRRYISSETWERIQDLLIGAAILPITVGLASPIVGIVTLFTRGPREGVGIAAIMAVFSLITIVLIVMICILIEFTRRDGIPIIER